jgi:hypothetical protein
MQYRLLKLSEEGSADVAMEVQFSLGPSSKVLSGMVIKVSVHGWLLLPHLLPHLILGSDGDVTAANRVVPFILECNFSKLLPQIEVAAFSLSSLAHPSL